jgi:2-oxoisovalerate dehydrogenase E2 component (dihydrolipoyl transacylase)
VRRRRLRGAARADSAARADGVPLGDSAARVDTAARDGGAAGPSGKPLAKPPVRSLARELGIDLATVTPTGPRGDITREDLRAAVDDLAATSSTGGSQSSRFVDGGAPGPIAERPVRGQRIPVRGVQRQMAQAMVRSMSTAPHVTEWVDVDVSATMSLVRRLREESGVRYTPLTIAAAAVVHAVRRTPIVNSSWIDLPDGSAEIEVYPFINLGVAVASERGLVVPHIPDAGALSLAGLAGAIADVTARARAGRLAPADSVGGTITITNIGVFGVDGGTPILNPGEAAILATGRVVARPWAVGGALAVRPVMQLSLSFDHRVVDGASGSAFLADVAAYLHDPSE